MADTLILASTMSLSGSWKWKTHWLDIVCNGDGGYVLQKNVSGGSMLAVE